MPIFFYLFAFLIVAGSLGVVVSRNPVYNVLWLIFTFLNTAGIFILLGAEFIAMAIVVVYVGAVAVLFLFVVMMLNVDLQETISEKFWRNRFLSLATIGIFIADMVLLVQTSLSTNYIEGPITEGELTSNNNTKAIGEVLYTDHFVSFQLAGIILLLAMIGCIVLTLRHRTGVKKQIVAQQLERTRHESIEIVKVGKGAGIDDINYR